MTEPSSPSGPPTSTPPPSDTRAGYVVLAGRPNAGKSTLLNAFLGQKLSIVTPKAQTTWRRITGILTDERAQMIFLDTPGLLDVEDLLQRSMLGAARQALEEADVLLLVLDATRDLDPSLATVIEEALGRSDVPRLAAVNKVDEADEPRVEALLTWAEQELEARPFRISALHGTGVEELRDALEDALPVGPFLYPADQIGIDPVRFFVSELVRETVFEQFREEVPYSTYARVEEYREDEDPVYIQVNVYVERDSQKKILIGKGGRAIRELGKAARKKIEAFIERRVYLDLWVKVLPGWRRKKEHLKRLGFRIPEERESAS